jgi:hypothetical protein
MGAALGLTRTDQLFGRPLRRPQLPAPILQLFTSGGLAMMKVAAMVVVANVLFWWLFVSNQQSSDQVHHAQLEALFESANAAIGLPMIVLTARVIQNSTLMFRCKTEGSPAAASIKAAVRCIPLMMASSDE